MSRNRRVLVTGIVLADTENLAAGIAENMASSRDWTVEQQWVAIGSAPVGDGGPRIIERIATGEPKFSILNRVLNSTRIRDYDYVVVTDDDIELPLSFLDRYLGFVDRCDLALAQPARTHDSYIDHAFVEQLDGITARETRFVEIGPLFSVRADALSVLVPFDMASPMGWGYDFTWPVAMQAANLKMGIVDAVPISHALRKPVANYVYADANQQMTAYLAARPHLEIGEAFYIVESFA